MLLYMLLFVINYELSLLSDSITEFLFCVDRLLPWKLLLFRFNANTGQTKKARLQNYLFDR